VGSAPDAVAVPADAVPADADAVADADALADGDGAVADVAELLEDEHPASVTSTPATAASAARAGLTPRTVTEDTALPTPDVDRTLDKVPVLVRAPGAARAGIRNNDAGTPAFASRRVGQRKGK
jgi:hypothetical protein